MKRMILTAALFVGLVGCTENIRARTYGGTMEINLPCNQKLFDITWKETQFWYATRPMRENDFPDTYRFQEKSSWGALEGTIVINECRNQ